MDFSSSDAEKVFEDKKEHANPFGTCVLFFACNKSEVLRLAVAAEDADLAFYDRPDRVAGRAEIFARVEFSRRLD